MDWSMRVGMLQIFLILTKNFILFFLLKKGGEIVMAVWDIWKAFIRLGRWLTGLVSTIFFHSSKTAMSPADFNTFEKKRPMSSEYCGSKIFLLF